MIYSHGWDKFFIDGDELRDYIYDLPDSPNDTEALLVLCEPVYLRPIDEDYWEACYSTEVDYELPDKVKDAIDELNKAIAEAPPASWEPGSKRLGVKSFL
jgi:hypothetical protein